MLTIAAGCGEKEPRADDPPATPTLPASVSPSTDSAAAGAQAAVAAYRGMWDAFVEASNNGVADPPALAKHASGSALEVLNRGLAANRAQQLASRGQPVMNPKLTSIGPIAAPTSAMIADCVDSTNWLLYKQNGQPANGDPGGRRKVTATVAKSGGTWKVTGFAAREVGTC